MYTSVEDMEYFKGIFDSAGLSNKGNMTLFLNKNNCNNNLWNNVFLSKSAVIDYNFQESCPTLIKTCKLLIYYACLFWLDQLRIIILIIILYYFIDLYRFTYL